MRHLFAVRSFLSALACALLCSCVTSRGAAPEEEDEGALGSFLDSGASGLVCDGTRLVGATSFSQTCLPTGKSPGPTVSGLEPLSAPLRECVLTSLPVETGGGTSPECLKGAAQVLQGRLRQLGWLEAEVLPATGRPDVSEAQLQAQLRSRYRVGVMRVEHSEEPGVVDPEKILVKARAAVPEGSWYTSGALAEIHARVFQMKKFRSVWVYGGEPDYRNKIIPVIIDVWEKPQKPRKVKMARPERPRPRDNCPRRDAICLNGQDCSYDTEHRCTVCFCRPTFR
ncbi:hypothetical protein [Hyalangium minutum]|uniref:Outer membrane protein n=1 Tax=Hyalangium minutum TaxID=394096 RepID=A0A085WK57_9BACT|nr:hypothetical protein [Hyalangium minutum]KFE68070.1 Outer membrane protein [Hyalangium minutum]